MHTLKAEILAVHFETTPEALLRYGKSEYVGLFKVLDRHYTCFVKGHPVPSNGFTYVSEVMREGTMFAIYRAHPKAYHRFISPRG